MKTHKTTGDLNVGVDAATRIENYLKEIEKKHPSRAALFRSVYYGKPSKAAAVKAKCLGCSCFQTEEIKHCPVVICELWRVRPYQDGPSCQTQASGKGFYGEKAAVPLKTAELS
jgi:hypothetical protein